MPFSMLMNRAYIRVAKLRKHWCVRLLALVLLGACSSNALASDQCLPEGQLWLEQAPFVVKSLKRAYHGGYRSSEGIRNLLCMDEATYARAQARYAELKQHEQDSLWQRYCVSETNAETSEEEWYCQTELMMLALRDTDGDNILDFRVKEFGSLVQNDFDADNDGIENLMDPRPLDGDAERDSLINNDSDGDGLPNHLDWSNAAWHPSFARKSPELIDTQRQVFEEFGIVLIEAEGSEISENFADMTQDVLQVFRRSYNRYNARDIARSITLADQYDYDPFGVLAEVSPVNGEIIIYEYGISKIVNNPNNLIAPFLVYIHEFAHVIQNAMDFPNNRKDLLQFNAHTTPRKFIKAINKLGWNASLFDNIERTFTQGFVDHGSEPVAFNQIFRNRKLEELNAMCAERGENNKVKWNADKLKQWRSFNIVTCYSLYSVREWHAEYVATAVLKKMFDYVKSEYPRHADAMIRHSQMNMYHDWGGEGNDYRNADTSSIRKISRELGIRSSLAEDIATKYVVNPYLHSFGLTMFDIGESDPQASR